MVVGPGTGSDAVSPTLPLNRATRVLGTRNESAGPTIALLALGLSTLWFSAGCEKPQSAQWVLNGFFDPTQVGQFVKEKRNEIRGALSILEEPVGIQNTEEPNAADLEPDYTDQRLAPGDVISI